MPKNVQASYLSGAWIARFFCLTLDLGVYSNVIVLDKGVAGLRIKEFAQKFHLSTDSIRYYEKIGLLQPTRMENGYRQYDKKCSETLQFILVLKRLGFTLQEIESLLQLQEKPVSSECNIVSNAFMQQKIDEISQQILFYQQAYQALTQVQQLMNDNKYEENKEVIQQLITDMYLDILNGGMSDEE